MNDHRSIYNICTVLCGLPKNLICSKCFFFFGPMPVNLDRQSLIDLYNKEYLLLEKSDGIRHLLHHNFEILSIIDRKLATQKIFSKKNSKKEPLSFLDGELTFNLLLEKYTYLIYDIGIITGDWRVSSWDSYSRSHAIKQFIFCFCQSFEMEKSFFAKKLFFYKYNIKKILHAVSLNFYTKEHVFVNFGVDRLFHCNKNDGIIFSPLRINYSLKTTGTTFKWKYEYENTMDLLIQTRVNKKDYEKKLTFPFSLTSIINRNKYYKTYYGKTISLSFKNKNPKWSNLKNIGEFRYIQKKGSWILKKYRFDKELPNSFKVLINTLKIMAESLNKFELIDNVIKFQIRKERGKCCEKY